MKVEVTQGDIDGGVKYSVGRCPIALAFRKLGHQTVIVGPNTAWIWEGRKRTIMVLPAVAKQMITDFDDGKEVFPLSFEVVEIEQ